MKELFSNEEEMWASLEKHTWFSFTQMKQVVEKKSAVFVEGGHGIYIVDINGKEYIDGHSMTETNILGFGNKRVIDAITNQLHGGPLFNPLFGSQAHPAQVKACEKIAETCHGDLNHVYMGITGSDTVEAAMNIARQYFAVQGKPNNIIISRWGAYHGSTLGAVSVTGHSTVRSSRLRNMAPGTILVPQPYCYRCLFGLEYPSCRIRCATYIDETIENHGPKNVAAFIGEPVMEAGPAGITGPDEYWPMVREICDKHKILLIADDIVAGLGRCGKFWTLENWGVQPDILVTAKGVCGGYIPVGAVVARDHVYEALQGESMWHGHSLSFYPAGCAGVIATIDEILENRLWENAAEVGKYLKGRLGKIGEKSKIVGTVHGRLGLLYSVELVDDKKTKKLSTQTMANGTKIGKKSLEKGLFCLVLGNIIMIMPPLIITKDEAGKLADILEEAIMETEAEMGRS